MSRRRSAFLALAFVGCGDTSSERGAVEPTPTQSRAKVVGGEKESSRADEVEPDEKAREEPRPTGTGSQDRVDRVRGPVRGSFVVERRTFVVGEPIFVRFHVESVGDAPLAFTQGGDNYAQGRLRHTWLVRDGAGEVVCDLRGRPEPMAGGGGKGPVTLKKGESWDAWLAPQTGCDALTAPGRYRLRGVRHLTDDTKMPEGCSPILVPDTTVQPLDDRGVAIAPACVDWLTQAPAIASEFEIEITAYDREVVRKAVERELAVEGDERMGLMASYGAWFCGHVGCELGRGDELDKWLGGALVKLPEAWPTKD